jgi:hypothetical protein
MHLIWGEKEGKKDTWKVRYASFALDIFENLM